MLEIRGNMKKMINSTNKLREPLGKTMSRNYNFPEKIEKDNFTFGNATLESILRYKLDFSNINRRICKECCL